MKNYITELEKIMTDIDRERKSVEEKKYREMQKEAYKKERFKDSIASSLNPYEVNISTLNLHNPAEYSNDLIEICPGLLYLLRAECDKEPTINRAKMIGFAGRHMEFSINEGRLDVALAACKVYEALGLSQHNSVKRKLLSAVKSTIDNGNTAYTTRRYLDEARKYLKS